MTEAQISTALAMWALERFGDHGWQLTVDVDEEAFPLQVGERVEADLIFQQRRSTLALEYTGDTTYTISILHITNILPTA